MVITVQKLKRKLLMEYLSLFEKRKFQLFNKYESLVNRKNGKKGIGNGIFERYKYPILTADHVPIHWQYDLNPETNPFFMVRLGINAVFNSGAIERLDHYTQIQWL